VADCQVSGAELLHPRDFSLGSIPAEQLRRSTAASACQIGNGRKRSGRVAEARDQLAIGDRPDPGGTDQPDALD
jgi:hypothetical protein